MKKNQFHLLLSVFLLAILLAGRVGIHLFHHHDSTVQYDLLEIKKLASNGSAVLFSAEHEADCALCKLDSFQELSISSILVFIFFLTVVKPVYSFLLTAFSQFSFFAKSRGPPVSVCM